MKLGRRHLISGCGGSTDGRTAMLHVASALVLAWPAHSAGVAERIAALPETEVRHVEGSRIIVVIEARESGAVGERLAQIADLDGVLSANLVFEQAVSLDELGEEA